MTVPPRAPSRRWYAVAALIALAGLVAAGIVVWRTVAAADQALERIVVPGEAELLLDASGTYTIYYEHRSVVDGRLFATGGEDVSDLRVAVTSVATGRELGLRPPAGDVEYQMGGRAGLAVLVFEVTEPGTHRLAGWYPEGNRGPDVVLAVGQGVGRGLAVGLLAGIGVAILTFGLAALIAARTFLRRRRFGVAVGSSTSPAAS